MSVPAQQMTPQPGMPPGGGASPAAPGGPGAAPTMTPQKNSGEQASADSQVQVALRMLERALVAHGSGSEKGAAIYESIGKLRKAFALTEDKATQIMPAEVKTALMSPAGEPAEGPQSASQPPPGASPAGPPG